MLINWLQNHLLTCPFKYLTGFDCPGCGFQRAVIALIKGNFKQSVMLYPATVPILLLLIFIAIDPYLKLDNPRRKIKRSILIITGVIVILSYGLKIGDSFRHHTTPAAVVLS